MMTVDWGQLKDDNEYVHEALIFVTGIYQIYYYREARVIFKAGKN